MDHDTATLDPQGKRRIDQVRVRSLAFRLKGLYPDVPDDDAEALAAALLEIFDERKNPTGDDVRRRLRSHGQSDDDAERLVRAIKL